MLIGHFAPALVAAAMGPRAPKLATAFIAAQLVDWAFFALAIIGVERMRVEPGATAMVPFDLYFYPYTHSLAGTAGFAITFGLIVAVTQRNALAGMLSALVVASHWLLDLVVHRPDLTLAGGDAHYGLGLWNYPAIAMPLEIALTVGALLFYTSRTRGPVGPPGVLLVAMLVLQAVNWFGPEPAEANLFLYLQALVAFALITVIAAWVGENRHFVRRGGLAAPGL
jgi:hypothetical protein